MRIKLFLVVLLAGFTFYCSKSTAASLGATNTRQVKPPPPPPPPPRIHVRNPFRHHRYVRSHHRIRLRRPPHPPGLPPPPPRP